MISDSLGGALCEWPKETQSPLSFISDISGAYIHGLSLHELNYGMGNG
jgi:hypothetical protein